MTDSQNNPFILPGLGQSGDAASNPLLASMEMMRKAWAGLMGPGGLAQAMPMAPPLNLEDLERRIAELRTVESWLRMNLSMLSSTIQGLEVQRSTINTLRSFVDSMGAQAGAAGASWGDASPLEVALGLKPGQRGWPGADAASKAAAGGRGHGSAFGAGASARADDRAQDDEAGSDMPDEAPAGAGSARTADEKLAAAADKLAESGAAAESGVGAPAFLGNAAQSASEAWWNLLNQQFGQLAAATAASMPGTMPGAGASGAAPAGEEAGAGKAAAKKAGPASKTAGAKAGAAKAGADAGATKPAAKSGGAKTDGGTKAAAGAARPRTSTNPKGAQRSAAPSSAAGAAKKPASKAAANGAPRNPVARSRRPLS